MLPTVTRSGKKLIDDSSKADIFTTDLAIYEVCNGLWKLATLIKTINLQEAQEIAALIKELTAKKLIQTINFTELDLPSTLTLAQKNQLTFYDASYIAVAQNIKATLVTEDKKLCKAANNSLKTMSYTQLQDELNKNT
jgi:predicted nucleic acid-binding protein